MTLLPMDAGLHFGTCSWKFDDWRGCVYSDAPRLNYLAEYSRKYACVEIDQWFWSLFGPGKVVLPRPRDVADYAAAVPEAFHFAVKMPNALTLTHFRPKSRNEPLVPNPHFLSLDLTRTFLDQLAPLKPNLGPMMFQFEYLNRDKMPSQSEFQEKLSHFTRQLPPDYQWCVESRNPNYLNTGYFSFLRDHNLSHVFEQGYYMPPVIDLYNKYAGLLGGTTVIRLHGPDWEKMEERTGRTWNRLVEPREADLDNLATVIKGLRKQGCKVWVFANNHFEGCAPLTLERLEKKTGMI